MAVLSLQDLRRGQRANRVGAGGRDAGEEPRRDDGHPQGGHRLRQPEQDRPQEPAHDARRQGLPLPQPGAPQGVQPLRQRAAVQVDRGLQDALRRRQPHHHPREHGGRVLGHRARDRQRRGAVHQADHGAGVDARRRVRLQVRQGQRAAQGDGRAQGQHHAHVGRTLPPVLPRGRREAPRDQVRGEVP